MTEQNRPDQPTPEHRRPEGVSDATVEALGKLSAALDHVEDARGHLYAFHRLMGSAETTLEEATAMVRDAGHTELADALDEQALGQNPLPGMWSFQMVEKFAEKGAFGPDVAEHVEAFTPFVKAGFDDVYVANMGPHYADMIAAYGSDVLPELRSRG